MKLTTKLKDMMKKWFVKSKEMKLKKRSGNKLII